MAKIRIFNKSKTRHVDITVADAADAKTIMQILARNDIPFILHGSDKEK